MSLSSKSNINPVLWGPYFWKVFHFAAYGYPKTPEKSDINAYKKFYTGFAKVLPCDLCTKDAQEMMKNIDWEKILVSKESLIKWTYDFHYKVNKKLNKESPSFEYFSSNFQKQKNVNVNECSNNYIIIITLLILIFLTFIAHYISGIPFIPSLIFSYLFGS